MEKAHAKEYEKVLKTISDPLREGYHFDQALGGIASLFENMRANTQGLINSHYETEKNIKGSVLPILDRLHREIKNKSKELTSGAVKGAKEVEKAREVTQKHIELLGQSTSDYLSHGGKITPAQDPYVLHRGVYHRLNRQILEENNNRQDLISVQQNFLTFEQHIIEVIQQALASFNQFMGGQLQRDQHIYADILATAQRIPPDFEWKGFLARNSDLLIDPNAPPRSVESIAFPNQNHQSTQPLIEGTLERKSRMLLSGYSTGYFVVTPAGYLHEFKDNDNFRNDPVPELSIYLPDAVIGNTNGEKFNIKGKDLSKGLSGKLHGATEFSFKAHTAQDAEKWFEVIRMAAGGAKSDASASSPISPIHQQSMGTVGGAVPAPPPSWDTLPPAGAEKPHIQTQNVVGAETVASPVTATPGGVHAPNTTPATATATHPPVLQGITQGALGKEEKS